MKRVLLAWVGQTDLDAAHGVEKAGPGPIGQAVAKLDFDEIVLLCNYPAAKSRHYVPWLRARAKNTGVTCHAAPLKTPMDFGGIYEHAVARTQAVLEKHGAGNAELTFHISPGTSAMAAVWIILSKTRFPAELIQSSKEAGVVTVSLPFDISADYLPDLLRRPDTELERLMQGLPPEAPGFDDILHRGNAMKQLIAQAHHLAIRDVTVLIEGETGTGKELLARAIWQSSMRAGGSFVPVNCGAIPDTLIDSILFGHARGAFTGAIDHKAGAFEEAHGGVIFLDEVGELSREHQPRLLRVLQEKHVVRVGESRQRPIDIRVMAATNRNLIEEVRAGRFREDLFHRLAVGILRVPPLRDRREDLDLLIDHFLARAAEAAGTQPGGRSRNPARLSVRARSLLRQHSWPGNVRELENTILRAVIWAGGDTIDPDGIRSLILPPIHREREEILGRALGDGLDVNDLIEKVRRHYVERAWEESHHNKTQAAKLIGLGNYQTFSNWMDQLGIGD